MIAHTHMRMTTHTHTALGNNCSNIVVHMIPVSNVNICDLVQPPWLLHLQMQVTVADIMCHRYATLQQGGCNWSGCGAAANWQLMPANPRHQTPHPRHPMNHQIAIMSEWFWWTTYSGLAMPQTRQGNTPTHTWHWMKCTKHGGDQDGVINVLTNGLSLPQCIRRSVLLLLILWFHAPTCHCLWYHRALFQNGACNILLPF